MKWLVLCRRESRFVEDLARYLVASGEKVEIRKPDVIVDTSVLNYDVVILKSKILIFLYAGFLAKFDGKRVIPDPMVAYRLRNRWEAELYLREMDINVPPALMGYWDSVMKERRDDFFPALIKPVMGSMSEGIEVVGGPREITGSSEHEPIYLQKMVKGDHFQVDFIGDEIFARQKEPLVHGTSSPVLEDIPPDIKGVVEDYKDKTGLFVGDLDIVVNDKVWVVDPGTFPSFEYLERGGEKVGSLLIEKLS